MKPLFCVDLTDDQENEVINGDQWCAKRPSATQTEAMERMEEHLDDFLEKASIPMVLRVIKWGLLIIGLIATEILDFWEELDWWWLAMPFGMLAVSAVLFLIDFLRRRSALASDEGVRASANLDTVKRNIFGELAVPPNAPDVDVLTFMYKVKNGEIVPKRNGMGDTTYDTAVHKIYVYNGNLCLADLTGRWDIPLSSIRGIRTVNKTVVIPDWNKETKHNKGDYKPFKIHTMDEGKYSFKPYHIVEFSMNGEDWGLYIPCYERPVLERLTGWIAE